MGEAADLVEELSNRGTEKGGGAEKGDASNGTIGPAEPAAPSAPPANDLEAPLLPPEQAPPPPQQQLPPPVLVAAPSPENDPLLYVFRVLSMVTAIGSLLCLVVNAISLLRSFDYRGFDYRVSVFVGILRSYTIAIAILVILAETEWEVLFRFWKVLEFWTCRGLFQILVAVQTRVMRRASGETAAESLLHEIASWWLFGCGIVYTVAGLLCLGRIKRAHMRKKDWRLRAQREIDDLHRRRADLEGQLEQ